MVISVRDGKEDITRFEYDSLGRTIGITGGDGLTVRYGYDSDGNTIITTDSLGNSSRMEYNQNGKIIRQVDAKGYITSYEYDDYSNLTKIIDPMLRERTYQYDPQTGKMTGMTDPMGRSTQYSCNDYCATKTITDPNNWTTKYYYDVKCRLIKIEYNDGSYYQFAYDSLGRKISETGGADGQGTVFGAVKYSNGGEDYNEAEYGEFKYGTDTPLYGFDPDLTTIYYSYDAAGRLTKTSYPAPPDAPLLPDGTRQRKDISYEYYADDKIKKITDAAGYERVYNYDNQNRLISITIDEKTITYHYDDDNYGRLDYIMLPNGVKKEYVYGEDDSLNAVLYTRNSGTITLFRFDYKYNKTGNISSIVKTDPYGNKSINSYNYDSVNRLLSVLKEGKGDSLKSWYDFDPMGNRLKKNLSGVLSGGQITKTENYDYNACDELKCLDGILFEYDMNGNLIRKTDPAEGQTGYVFNYANRLFKTVFPDNTESVNNYASSGLRSMSRDKTGNTTHYYWDGLNIESIPNAISESDVEGNITNTYLPGIGFRHINNNNNWRWFITDHLGSIIALTDDAGNICDIYEYDEYGIQTTSKGTSFNPYRYIGQQFDEVEGLLYLRARYYDPETGRFVSRDPIGIAGGMNLYGYAHSNAIRYYDSSGLDSEGTGFIKNISPSGGPTIGMFGSLRWHYFRNATVMLVSVSFYKNVDTTVHKLYYAFSLTLLPYNETNLDIYGFYHPRTLYPGQSFQISSAMTGVPACKCFIGKFFASGERYSFFVWKDMGMVAGTINGETR